MKNRLLFNFLIPFATSNPEGKTFRNLLALIMVMVGMNGVMGQTYYSMSSGDYTQTFTGLSTGYPTNMNGLAVLSTGSIPSSTKTTTATNVTLAVSSTSTSIGYDAISANSTKMIFLCSGGTDNTSAVACDLNLNFSGRTAGSLSFKYANILNSSTSSPNGRSSSLIVYYSIDGSTWNSLGGPYTVYNNTGASTSNIPVSVTLPSELDNQLAVKLRFYVYNGGTSVGAPSGSRPKISLDDIIVTSTASSSTSSTSSNIISNSLFTHPTNIAYTTYQAASGLTSSNSIEVGRFDIQDGGGNSDSDALSTILTACSFAIANSANIRALALFDGTTNVSEITTVGSTGVFSGLTLEALDNGSKTFSIRATFNNAVSDNQQISFAIASASASNIGSGFAAANAGGSVTSTTGDDNRIEVTLTNLVFSQQPTDVNTNVSMSPAVTVTAKDANNNNDLDFTDTIRVSSTGTMIGSPVSVAAVNGVATFSSITHTNTATGLTLLAERNNSGSWDLDVTSNPFSVAVVSTATDYFRSLATGSWASPSSWESSADNINWINATLTPTSNANVISIRNGHTVTINASVTVDEVIVLSGGILTASAVMTVNNGSGDDITIESGGRVNYTVAPVYSTSAIRIKTGGIVSVQVSGMTGAAAGVNATTHMYEDGSILEWNLASGTPSAAGVTYFPNVTTEIPIFRFAAAPNGNLGGTNPTVINGRIELATGVSISWSGNGTKTFRNGVVGLGGLNTMSTASGTGVWNISGTTAQLGTNGGTSLTLSNINGIAISGTTTATVVGNLNIGTTTNLTIAASGTLNTGGFLTFKSDASGTASLGNSAGTITGNVTVERYIPARRAFRFLSSSVNTASSIKLNWQENAGTTAGLGTHITGVDGITNGFDATSTNNPSLYTFDNSTGAWVAVTSTLSNTLTAGTPYRLMVRGDRSIDLTTNTPTATPTVLRATGTLNVGDFSPTLNQAVEGFSFVGNPYQAPVDIKAVLLAATNMNTGLVYYWDPTLNARGGYVARDLSANSNSPASSFNQYLQPGQAVFVKKANTTVAASMTFTESHKAVANAAVGVFRTANTSAYGLLRVNLQANVNNQWQTIEGTLAIFNPGFNTTVTDEDANKMANLDEEVSFVQNNTSLAITCQPNPTAITELPIRLTNTRYTNYQWQFELDNYDGATPYLFDTLNNSYTQINNGTVLPFTADANTTNRFKIVFQNGVLSNATFHNQLAIYPNPAKSGASFYVEGISEATVTVSNLLGQNVPVQTKNQGTTIQVTPNTNLSQGVYLVNITKQGTTQQVKWIVE